MRIATLTTGAKVREPVAMRIHRHVELAARVNGVDALSEIRRLCSDPDYQSVREAGQMHVFGLLENWEPTSKRPVIDDEMRDVVLAAVTGDGEDIRVLTTDELVVSFEGI